jgi:tetratricopeptide (TPR) repeat protein
MLPNPKNLRLAVMFLGCFAASAAPANRLAFADARAEALAKGPALEAGFYALGTNAALLADLPALQLGFTHKFLAAPNTTSEIVGVALPLDRYGTLAGGFGTVLVNDVEYYDPENNRAPNTYLYHDDRLAAGYGVRLTRWLGLGAALNYDRHRTAPEKGGTRQTVASDAGAYVRTPELGGGPLTFGVVGRNLLATSRATATGDGDYRESAAANAGASWERYIGNHRLTLAASGPLEEPVTAGVAGELLISSKFAARASVTRTGLPGGEADIRPAAGLGFTTALLSFDYCYLNRALGNYHYFSFSVNPGRESRTREERRRQVEEWLAEARAYFDAGNYDLAAKRFEAVLKWEPGNAVAREYLPKAEYYAHLGEGTEYLTAQDWARARREFKAAAALVPQDFLATEYLARVDQLEEEDNARLAEERRVAQKRAEAGDAIGRGAYLEAIKICGDILAAYPDDEKANGLLAKARRELAVSIAKLPPEERPEPEEVEDRKPPAIPPEAVKRYREGSSLLAQGSLNQAVTILAGVVNEYPTYGAARAKLVQAYLYQGLDLYSKGSAGAALNAWRRAAALDPGNEKAQRYIKRAESEIK